MRENTIKIAIVDDHNLFRKALRNLLSSIDDFEVVLESTNGCELVDKLFIHKDVEIVLLDLCMPGIRT